MLMANKVKDFTQLWWNAKVYRPDGIVAGVDTWEALVEKRKVKSTPYPWEGLNQLTRGHRPYELVTITSGSGMGKSQFIREIENQIAENQRLNQELVQLRKTAENATAMTAGVVAG